MGNLELHVLYVGHCRRRRRRRYWGNWKGRRDCDYVNFFAYDNGTGRPCTRKFSFHNRRNYILTRLASPAAEQLDLHFVMAPRLTYRVSNNRTAAVKSGSPEGNIGAVFRETWRNWLILIFENRSCAREWLVAHDSSKFTREKGDLWERGTNFNFQKLISLRQIRERPRLSDFNSR